MTGYLYTLQQQRLIDNTGLASGGTFYFYHSGTSVLATIYTDKALTIPHSNPFTVDAAAAIPSIFLDTATVYRCRVVYPNGFVDDTDPIDELSGDLISPTGATFVNYTAPNNGQTQTVAARLDQRLNLLSYMTAAQINQSLACRVQTDSAPDITTVIQGLINSAGATGQTLRLEIPSIVDITSSLSLPQGTSLNWDGNNSAYTRPSGGLVYYSGGGLRWNGAANGVILKLNTTSGGTVKNLLFETKSANVDTISITGVEGIQLINRGATHRFKRESCNFSKLGYGMHFDDDGGSGSSDFNMDGQLGIDNWYSSCVEAIRVNQTNVYGALELNPSFSNNANYSKYMLNIVKGHMVIDAPDCFGAMKDASTVGGKDGIGFLCQFGHMAVTNIHSEIKNAPLVDWWAPGEGQDICYISLVGDNTETASLPSAWEIRNKTNVSMIVQGSPANPVEQFVGSTGSITIIGAKNPTATTASVANAVVVAGGALNSRPGPFGTIPNGTSGGGQATLQGYLPRLRIVDITDGNTTSLYSHNAKLEIDGNRAGPIFDLAGTGASALLGVVDLATNANPLILRGLTLAAWNTQLANSIAAGSYIDSVVCTDSTVTAVGNSGAIVAGGGANKVRMWFDGTNWRIL